MLTQIFAAFYIGGFIALAVIGHVALFHALLLRPVQPVSSPSTRRLQVVASRKAEAPKRPARALRVA